MLEQAARSSGGESVEAKPSSKQERNPQEDSFPVSPQMITS